MEAKELFRLASEARRNAYTPYSKFRVGAALLTKSGRIFTGCNIENASYGATCCAERVAIFKAISEGETAFEAIAVQGDNSGPTFPCGICRQVMSEFSQSMEVILESNENDIEIYTLEDLLPYGFKLSGE